MSEYFVVNGPECDGESSKFLFAEEMLWLLLVHDRAFLGQCIPYPLMPQRLSRGHVA